MKLEIKLKEARNSACEAGTYFYDGVTDILYVMAKIATNKNDIREHSWGLISLSDGTCYRVNPQKEQLDAFGSDRSDFVEIKNLQIKGEGI